jgi:hypothetical protein
MNNLLCSSYYEGDKYENNNKAYATEGILNILYRFNQGYKRYSGVFFSNKQASLTFLSLFS